MPERRQAFRREPIEVELGGEVIVSVAPVSWLQRNDFGNELIRQHVEIVNESIRMYVDPETQIPQLEMKLGEKFSDPYRLFELGLEKHVFEQVKAIVPLYQNQVVEILLAVLEVNDLPQLRGMIDPNLTTPTQIGGLLSNLLAGDQTSTPRTESSPDSDSTDSTIEASDPSLIQSSPSS